jgi:type IV pilus assembly protein PilW
MLGIVSRKKGFTFPELLVVMVISGIVMAGIYSTHYTQQKSYVTHEQLVTMQQNLRAGMYLMEREIRMAGCDPTKNANAGIATAHRNAITFTSDITGGESDGVDNDDDGATDEADEENYGDGDTGDTNENITYALGDGDGDGDNDLLRNGTVVAENIDALNFVYLDGTSPPNVLDDDGSGNVTTSISEIRSVQITIVARTDREDPHYTDTTAYYNQQDPVNPILAAQNDGHRRELLTTEVKCRNLGL